MTPKSKTTPRQRVLLILFGLILGCGGAEVLVRTTDLDVNLLWPTLYFVEGEFFYLPSEPSPGGEKPGQGQSAAIYRPSDTPGRLYELIPGTSVECANCVHPKEAKYSKSRININSLGFRGPEREIDKPPGVQRIIILGGSNTYGASVSDEDTLPAQLEERLNSAHPGKFEVWNAGLNAYVASQKVIYANQIIARYSPDLLIFQHTNRGRRAFFYMDENPSEQFDADPTLYVENLQLTSDHGASTTALHRKLVSASGLYRAIAAAHLRIVGALHHEPGVLFGELNNFDDDFARESNWRAWTNFLDEHRDLDILVTDPVERFYCKEEVGGCGAPPIGQECRDVLRAEGSSSGGFPRHLTLHPDPVAPNLSYFSLCFLPSPIEYEQIHPPAYVYRDYAEQLAERLLRNELRPDSE